MFDDMIAHVLSNTKLNPIVTELFIRGKKLNILLVFIRQSYFDVQENVRLNSTYYFTMKIETNKNNWKSKWIAAKSNWRAWKVTSYT